LKNGLKHEPFLSHQCDLTQPIICVEGIKDAITLKAKGELNVIALGSTKISQHYLDHFKHNFVEDITLCYDYDEKENGDFPGMDGTIDSIKKLASYEAKISVINPKNLGNNLIKSDPHDFTVKHGISRMLDLLSNKQNADEFYFNYLEEVIDPQSLLIEVKKFSATLNKGGKLSPDVRSWMAEKLKLSKAALDTYFALEEIKKIPLETQKRIDVISKKMKYDDHESTLNLVMAEGLSSLEQTLKIS
jgi:DNA primase